MSSFSKGLVKSIKNAYRLIVVAVDLVLLIYVLFVFLFQLTYFQTKVAQVITAKYSADLKTELSLERLRIDFFNRMVVDELYVSDQQSDTLIYAKQIDFSFDLSELFRLKARLNSICLSDPVINFYRNEGSRNTNLQFIIDHFSPPDTTDQEVIVNLALSHFEIKNGLFRYHDYNGEAKEIGFDSRHMDVEKLNLYMNELEVDSNRIHMAFCELSLSEKSFEIKEFSAGLDVGPEKIEFRTLDIVTGNSQIHGYLSLNTESWEDYKDFLQKVSFRARFLPSDIAIKDLAYFVPDLQGMNDIPQFSGNISGPIGNIEGENVRIALANHSNAHLNFKIKGLPDFEKTYFNLYIRQLVSSKRGIERIQIPPFSSKNYIKLPDNFSTLGQVVYSGKISGYPRDMLINGSLITQIGSLNTNLQIKNNHIFSYEGSVEAKSFEAGTFFDVKKNIGKISLAAKIKGSGLDKESIDASITGTIESLELKNYTYHNAFIQGNFKQETFKGNIKVNDPYVKLDFTGKIDLRDDHKDFNFKADITDLYPRMVLGMDHIDSSASISTDLNIDIRVKDIDNIVGIFNLNKTHYLDKENDIISEYFNFTSTQSGNEKSLVIESDMFDFSVIGRYDLLDGFKSLKKLIRTYLPNLEKEEVDIEKQFDFDLEIKDYSLLEKMVSPGTSFGAGTNITGKFDSDPENLDIKAIIYQFTQGNFKLDTSEVAIYTSNDALELNGKFSHYSFGKDTKNRSVELKSRVINNHVSTHLKSYGEGPFSSDLNFESDIIDKNTINSQFVNSHFNIEDRTWEILDSNLVEVDSGIWTFQNLSVAREDHKISLNGILSHNEDDELTLEMENFDMSMFNPFLEKARLEFGGTLNGKTSVRNVYHEVLFTSDLTFDELTFNENHLGSGYIKSTWDNIDKALNLDGLLKHKNIATFKMDGSVNTKIENSPLQIDLSLNEVPLSVLEPFTVDILSDFKGMGSGLFQIRGQLASPEISGLFYLKEASAKIDYTKVTYELSKDKDNKTIPVKFTPDSIIIPEFMVTDKYGKNGLGSVAFIHNRFKKFETDLKLNANNLFVLNTGAKDNTLFYGKAYVSGSISIWAEKGYSKIDMDISTEKNTVFNLPIDESQEITENKFIVFEKPPEDTLDLADKNAEKADSLNVDLNMKLRATDGALARIVFDEYTGDVIETRGSGDLEINFTPKDGLIMNGEYTINTGTYVFSLQTVVSKKFIIESGSRIKWNGDPYKGEMNITTAYKLRARLIDILPAIDDGVNYNKKIPIDLRLKLTESVENPIIAFEVFLPDSKESVRGQLATELSNENCLNQQVFSLLILSSFTPCEAKADNTASTNVGKSTAYEAMSNQLSGWLSQISDDVDIGFSYQPEIDGEEVSSEQVEVAMSTQLFNDRLILDGNVGYGNQTGTNQNTKDWAGEFTVEYKIKPDGRWRVKAFNKVNDRSVVENDNLYIQGVGLRYSTDFGNVMTRAIRRAQRKEEQGKIDE